MKTDPIQIERVREAYLTFLDIVRQTAELEAAQFAEAIDRREAYWLGSDRMLWLSKHAYGLANGIHELSDVWDDVIPGATGWGPIFTSVYREADPSKLVVLDGGKR